MKNIIYLTEKEAYKAYKKGDVPVGAIIIKNNKIVAKAYNKKEKKQITTKHAEILAIEKACKKLKTWHLDDCEIYTTMEPCLMCFSAIEQSRIKKIIYGLNNYNFGFESKYKIKTKINIEKYDPSIDYIGCVKLFFKKQR